MDSMRRNAQKMMPHIMAMNKDPNVGMKNNRQPKPGVSNLTAYAKGGKVKSDAKQDKSMLARHNKLMHPGQKSKLKNGGMVKKYADGKGVYNKYSKEELASTTSELNERDRVSKYKREAEAINKSVKAKMDAEPESITVRAKKPSSFGEAFKAARKEQGAGGTFTFNGKKYSTNRADDDPTGVESVVAYNKKKNPGSESAIRQRFAEDLGMKKGGKVKAKGDKKKVMGTVGEAKSIMAALQKARRPATPMPGTRMAGLGMAPPMAPPMKHGGKVMKKAAGGAAKLRKKSPMPNKIKMMLYGKGG